VSSATIAIPDAWLAWGLPPGEKIHKERIASSGTFNTIDLGDYNSIYPIVDGIVRLLSSDTGIATSTVSMRFPCNSVTNPAFLSLAKLRVLIHEHVDPGSAPR
jgi:hypothetical protein